MGMLVLTRKEGEKVLIADAILLQINKIGRENVRLGFDASKHIKILRAELNNGAEARSQVLSEDALEAWMRLEELARTRNVSACGLLNELIRRFLDDAKDR